MSRTWHTSAKVGQKLMSAFFWEKVVKWGQRNYKSEKMSGEKVSTGKRSEWETIWMRKNHLGKCQMGKCRLGNCVLGKVGWESVGGKMSAEKMYQWESVEWDIVGAPNWLRHFMKISQHVFLPCTWLYPANFFTWDIGNGADLLNFRFSEKSWNSWKSEIKWIVKKALTKTSLLVLLMKSISRHQFQTVKFVSFFFKHLNFLPPYPKLDHYKCFFNTLRLS